MKNICIFLIGYDIFHIFCYCFCLSRTRFS
uniref:Uncharacterized protein n=1 Tax=Arundo donax TaxID=35708 RepID=A0A0A9FGR3_ARUDO